MSKSGFQRALVNLGWLTLGVTAGGCLDPLVEDPGVKNEVDRTMPIPVSPAVGPAASGVGGSSGSSGPVIAVAPTSTSTTTAATGTATSTAPANGSTSAAQGTNVTPQTDEVPPDEMENSDPGATGEAGDLDAGAWDDPDADAGPDGSVSDENQTMSASSSASG